MAARKLAALRLLHGSQKVARRHTSSTRRCAQSAVLLPEAHGRQDALPQTFSEQGAPINYASVNP